MTFEEAMHDSCRELGLDSHIKTIEYKNGNKMSKGVTENDRQEEVAGRTNRVAQGPD